MRIDHHLPQKTLRRLMLASTALAGASLLALPLAASAQAAWPSKPIRMVVGYPAGSSPDIQARMLVEPLSRALGQPVVVDNKPGAGGNIGADIISKADDNHTIGVIGNGPLTSSKFLYSKLPYDPLKDLAPLALIGAAPLVWVATGPAAKSPPAEYIKQLRSNGDKDAYGSVGPGSGGHLGMELVKQQLGINPLHVPFNGGPPILNAMAGGQIQMTLLPAVTVAPMMQAGKLSAVAVTTAKRSPLAPDLPSMEQIGAKGVNIEVWNAVMGPAKMPAAYQARLSAELVKILNSREIRRTLFLQGWKADDSSPTALVQRIKSDTAAYGELIAKKGIKLE